MAVQQPRGYGGYHGTDGGQEPDGGQQREEVPSEASPRHVKENHIPRELRRLHEHSLSLSDSEAKSTHPRRTRASSVPDPTSTTAPPRRQLASQSADQGVKKRYADALVTTLSWLQYLCISSLLIRDLACLQRVSRVSACKPCVSVHDCSSMLACCQVPTLVNNVAGDRQQTEPERFMLTWTANSGFTDDG